MKAACSSEMLVTIYQGARRHVPKDCSVNISTFQFITTNLSFIQSSIKHPIPSNPSNLQCPSVITSVLWSLAEFLKCTIATDRQTDTAQDPVANNLQARGNLQLNQGSCEVKEPEGIKLFQWICMAVRRWSRDHKLAALYRGRDRSIWETPRPWNK